MSAGGMVGVLAVALLMGGCAADIVGGAEVTETAVVLERFHTDASTGVGYAGGSRGGGVVVISNPEKWTVVVRTESGLVESFNASARVWADTEPGKWIPVCYRTGRWTGLMYRFDTCA